MVLNVSCFIFRPNLRVSQPPIAPTKVVAKWTPRALGVIYTYPWEVWREKVLLESDTMILFGFPSWLSLRVWHMSWALDVKTLPLLRPVAFARAIGSYETTPCWRWEHAERMVETDTSSEYWKHVSQKHCYILYWLVQPNAFQTHPSSAISTCWNFIFFRWKLTPSLSWRQRTPKRDT